MKHEPKLDDYTPDNVSGATIFSGGLILLLIAMAIFFAVAQSRYAKDCHNAVDTETVSTSER